MGRKQDIIQQNPADLTVSASGREDGKMVRTQRYDKEFLNLSERQFEVLRWIGEQYTVRIDHVQELFGRTATRETGKPGKISISLTRRILTRKWLKHKLVSCDRYKHHGLTWIWLSNRCLNHLEMPFRSREPSISYLDHYHCINSVRLVLEKQGVEKWVSERFLKYEMRKNEECEPHHAPDGLATYEGKDIAIEVELTRKDDRRLKRIVKSLDSHYDYIWYFVSKSAKLGVKQMTSGNRKFVIYDLADVIGYDPS